MTRGQSLFRCDDEENNPSSKPVFHVHLPISHFMIVKLRRTNLRRGLGTGFRVAKAEEYEPLIGPLTSSGDNWRIATDNELTRGWLMCPVRRASITYWRERTKSDYIQLKIPATRGYLRDQILDRKWPSKCARSQVLTAASTDDHLLVSRRLFTIRNTTCLAKENQKMYP
ncbi:uncharacterized protein LOC110832064 [Zootermopsis nevadensis]|uniref:uncharacterized protein LOC110832064 n=1 Tax=Zootermopsis nevadensis TaxID=136037 RepID=UPI000B8E4063|nr:uncharacterized protein LOC110832064 [Zootermopsis nevadensis]